MMSEEESQGPVAGRCARRGWSSGSGPDCGKVSVHASENAVIKGPDAACGSVADLKLSERPHQQLGRDRSLGEKSKEAVARGLWISSAGCTLRALSERWAEQKDIALSATIQPNLPPCIRPAVYTRVADSTDDLSLGAAVDNLLAFIFSLLSLSRSTICGETMSSAPRKKAIAQKMPA